MALRHPDLIVTGPTLRAVLGVSTRQFHRLTRAGVIPRHGRMFDLRKAVPAYVKYLREGRESSSAIAEATLQLRQAQRREIEARTRRAERDVVSLDEVGSVFEAAMTLVGGQLDGIAGRLCAELAQTDDPAIVREKLFHECRRIRNAAAAELETLAGDPARSPSAGGAIADESGHVG